MSPEEEAQDHMDRVLHRKHVVQADLFAELDATLASLDLTTPGPCDEIAKARILPSRPAIEAWQNKASAEKEAKAREHAEKQAAFEEIEAWRAANPEEHSKRRRDKRRNKRLAETGTLPRIYRRGKTPEEKRADANERKQKSRASMTPEQKKADRKRTQDGTL